MCITDTRLGRLVRTVVTVYDAATQLPATILPNRDRIGLMFGFSAATATTAAGVKVCQADGSELFSIGIGAPMQTLRIETHGDLVTKGFQVAALSVVGKVSVTEMILPEDVLNAEIGQFKAKGY